MNELDLIKQFCEKQITNAERRIERLNKQINRHPHLTYMYSGERAAFVKVIKEVQQILKYSVVKPSERRSPTDELFNGCKPPDERQNPQEEFICLNCGASMIHVDNNVLWQWMSDLQEPNIGTMIYDESDK